MIGIYAKVYGSGSLVTGYFILATGIARNNTVLLKLKRQR